MRMLHGRVDVTTQPRGTSRSVASFSSDLRRSVNREPVNTALYVAESGNDARPRSISHFLPLRRPTWERA